MTSIVLRIPKGSALTNAELDANFQSILGALGSVSTTLPNYTGTAGSNVVLSTSPTLVTPILGTPTSGTLTNCSGLPVTGITGMASGVATFLATPSSVNLKSAIIDETGSGSLVFATSPTLVTPALGTPTSGNLVNCTFPILNQSTTGTASGLSATLAVGSGGTGLTSLTTGRIPYGNGTSALNTSANFVFDGTNLGIGAAIPNSYSGYTTVTIDGTLGVEIDFNVAGVLKSGLYSDNSGLSLFSGANFIFQDGFYNELARLTNLGDLGLGTSTPSHYAGYTALTLGGVNNAVIDLLYNNGNLGLQGWADTSSGGSGFRGYNTSGNLIWQFGYTTLDNSLYLGTDTALPLYFYTNNFERMRITTEGRVGIGTTPVPTALLDVNGSIKGAVTQGTVLATTSGTSKQFTGIPSWVKKITISFAGVNTASAALLLLQIGTGGTATTSGYGQSGASIGGSLQSNFATNGFAIGGAAYTGPSSGNIMLVNNYGNIWSISGNINGSTYVSFPAGIVSLAGALDNITLTTTAGIAFNAGTINILYEG